MSFPICVLFMIAEVSRGIDEIRGSLEVLSATWSAGVTSERGAAQSFLNDLVAAYTGASVIESGGEFERPVKRDEGRGFIDMIWDGVVLVEMKAPKETPRLDQHRAQLLDYWRNCADAELQRAAPPYAILCSFTRFEVWEPGRYPNGPVDSFPLDELADHAESLLFLAGRKPIYGGPGAAVTKEAAEHMVALYFQLVDREAAVNEVLHRWIMQTVWALFAEDLGLLPEHPVETLLQALRADTTRSTIVELADLYRRLNTEDAATRNRARPTEVPYVNGELFAEPAEVHLEPDELDHLLAACRFDWRHVNPTVFGALMEGCLGHERRWELGAHYTSEEDILSIVRPVIVHPWVERIEAADTPADALGLIEELSRYRVLDPAMGCGNFLSIAYRELRAIERLAHERTTRLHHEAGLPAPLLPRYPIDNLHGIEIDPFAVEVAKVTLWMTHALETRRYAASAENPLPLHPLRNLVCADSLKVDWPDVEAIIGNPPFHGDRNLRSVVGDEYIDWLKERFGVGVKDHCVYFLLKAQEEVSDGGRCGFVATSSIRHTKMRNASLARILASGSTLFSVTSSKPWSGEAAVHVSLVCWIKGPYEGERVLDGARVERISSGLMAGVAERSAEKLKLNSKRSFQGFLTRGTGFIIGDDEALELLERDQRNAQVIKRYLTGDDLLSTITQEPTRWVIDFAEMPLEEARAFPEALRIVEERVLPGRLDDPAQMKRWWQFWNTRSALREHLASMERFACASRHGKRFVAAWARTEWDPSDACVAFVIDDDFGFGILNSKFHQQWATEHSSTIGDLLRYTPTSAFETFPFPSRTRSDLADAVCDAARTIHALRRHWCGQQRVGLTAVYNLMDEGGVTDLKAAHDELDRAVAAAYGWDPSILSDESAILDALYDLNARIASGDIPYDPFGALGASR
jgi:hypothetical protein